MSPEQSDIRKHPRQDCHNCRRKKARCPGEKPFCSSCARLDQRCSYPSTINTPQTRWPVGNRLAFVEAKLDLVLEGLGSRNSLPRDMSQSPGDTHISVPNVYSENGQCVNHETSILPHSVSMERALDVYFRHFHRQPIWCVDRDTLFPYDTISEELACAILALTSCFLQELNQLHYSNRARSLIMLRIANGTVGLSTIESLCLLSFSFFLDGETNTGQFHLRLGLELCQSAQLDRAHTYKDDDFSERKKRVYWSLQLLEQCHGLSRDLLCPGVGLWPFLIYVLQTVENISCNCESAIQVQERRFTSIDVAIGTKLLPY